MADFVSPIIQDTVASTNLKVKAEAAVDLYLESQKMLHFHNNQLMTIGNQSLAAWSKSMHEPDPVEAASSAKVLNADFEALVTRVLAALAAGQIGNKAANTTPPVTP